MVNSIQATNYGRERLKALGLTHAEGFTYTSQGNIDIQYYTLLGDRQYYNKISSRKTFAECPDEFLNRAPYKATRYAPENMPYGRKYNRPAGTSVRTYIPFHTQQLFKDSVKDACLLKRIKTAIFTEGEIKTAYSNKHYLSDAAMFGFSGISCYTLCNEIKTALKRNAFKNLVINYDADATRSDDKTRLAQFFNSAANFYNELKTFYILQNEALPRVFICIQKPEQIHKGIDDMLLANGQQAAASFITFKNSEYFTFAEIKQDDSHQCLTKFFNYSTGRKNDNEAIFLKAPYYSNKTEKVRTRFTSILKDNDITGPNFFGKVYNVATGTGKTTAVIQAASKQKIIFFAPLNAIIKQVYNDALKQGIDAAMFNGNTKYRKNVQGIIERFSQLQKKETLFADDLPQLIICTFQSSKKLHNLLDKHSKEYNIIIDEFHTLASSNLINEHANNILSITGNYKSITGLTGTPIDISHPTIKKMPQVNVKLTGAPTTPAHFIAAADPLQAAAQIFIKANNEGRRATVYFNDTKEGLQDFLLLIGNTPANVFNSITKGNFDEFLNTGLLSKEGGIIATDSYALGLNNLDERQCDVIILGKHHPANIKQFKERERYSKCNLYIVQAKQPKKENVSPYLDDKNELIERTKQQLKSLKKQPSSYINAIRNALQFMHILETPAGLDINYLSIDNYIFKQQTNYFNSSPYNLLKELSNYGFAGFTDKKLNFSTDNAKRNDDFKTASLLRRQQNKAVKHELYCDALNLLQSDDDAKILALNKAAECTDDSEFYSMFIDIRKHCSTDKQALELFKLSEGKRAKVKQIILRLSVKKANFNTHSLGNAPAEILRTFAAGQELTADDIRTNFIKCLQTDATINTAEYRDATINYVLKKLRLFFDVKLYGKEKKKYRVSNLANCFF
jgi:hypothetical protein